MRSAPGGRLSFRLKAALAAIIASALSVALYLAAAETTLRSGYPLDDAWIHQVYARNLGLHAEWAFAAGEPSAGSTSPLWVAYLALGYLLRLPHQLWTYLGGALLLAGLGWLSAVWLRSRLASHNGYLWALAAVIPVEWHLVWASLSGMETVAFCVLAVSALYLDERQRAPAVLLGGLIGAGVWLRPEALLLGIVPLARRLMQRRAGWLGELARLATGVAVPLAGYLLLQRALSGNWWPNTFFAKQAEYMVLREIPLSTRLLAQLGVPGEWLGAPGLEPGGPLVGMLALLFPGLLLLLVGRVRQRRWTSLLPLAWCGLHVLSYALRLPVTYQHGRYAIPVIPVLLVLAIEGMAEGLDFADRRRLRWVLARSWPASVLVLAGAFWVAGATAYARDVAIIESEMVDTARWIERNTDRGDVVAAHDIGALGYFADRELLDLAGLVSPEVIPFIRDQAELEAYLNRRQADYLVTFPGWYPELVRGRSPLYLSSAGYSPAAGGENMAVYAWNPTSVAPCTRCAILAANLAQEG